MITIDRVEKELKKDGYDNLFRLEDSLLAKISANGEKVELLVIEAEALECILVRLEARAYFPAILNLGMAISEAKAKRGIDLKYDEEDEELSAIYEIRSEADLEGLIGWKNIAMPTILSLVKVFSYKNAGKQEEIHNEVLCAAKNISEADKQEILSKIPKKMHDFAKSILYPN